MASQTNTLKKIFIVDDSALNRQILGDILSEEYDIIEAENGEDALEVLKNSDDDIALMLLDINMPKLSGVELLEIMKDNPEIPELPVIMISAERSRKIVEKCFELGATDYISRPFDAFIVRKRVDNTIVLYAKQRSLEDMVIRQIYKNERNNRMMIEILSHIVEFRNGESGQHVLHIQTITELLLKRLVEVTDIYELSSMDISLIATASAMHDIGKIAIPSRILNKPGSLTAAEFGVVKQHTVLGASMLQSLKRFKSEKLVQVAYDICRWHHERYDGGGYPDGLVGEDIPIAAQVVSVADVYDALTSERCYKEAYSHEKAMTMILDGQCGKFNPILVKCLQDIEPQIARKLRESDAEQMGEPGLETALLNFGSANALKA